MSEDKPSQLGRYSELKAKPNHLISEKSPYLLQHAYNPVDWHAWNKEAFELANKEDKPIFLSIGYSTCHWCHVMAHESFEDVIVAELMNEVFVSVKVDREERPDIDQVYMKVCQMMTGRGGWPLTIIMTPDKRPFFASTYIPKRGRFGLIGMIEIIPRIKELWNNRRNELISSSDNIIGQLKQDHLVGDSAIRMDALTLAKGYGELARIFDIQNGGFGTAPKFPTPHNLLFLLRYWRRSKDMNALEMVEATLQAMHMGGIYDQVGFGFHRYSTDANWFVPHFEKMLYDQALHAIAYAEAYQTTQKVEFGRTVHEILEYVLRDMTSPEGGFYSAEDADSEDEEGKYYLWTADEMKDILDKEEFKLVIRLFDVHENGNFEKGRNILRLRSSFQDAASILKIDEQELLDRFEMIRLKLLAEREKRIRPLRDDKILTDWNGLMIAAFAKAAQTLDEPRYASAAQDAADFILKMMRSAEGRLLHRYHGNASIQANLDDYAFLVWGLIDLYETVFDFRYLRAALDLNEIMLQYFWDEVGGGLFFTPHDGEPLIVRQKEIYDGAVPSGNSTAMLNLLRLSHLTGDHKLEEKAHDLGQAFASTVANQPTGHTMLLSALDFSLGPTFEVALIGNMEDKGILEMLNALRSRFIPNSVVIVVSGEEIRRIAEFTRRLSQIDGKATAYVCSGYSCNLPTNDPARMVGFLENTTS